MMTTIVMKSIRTVRLVTAILGFGLVLRGQSSVDGSTPPAIAAGAPAGAYLLSGFETVNLFNGQLNFRLPLATTGAARGAFSPSVGINIEKRWVTDKGADGQWFSNDPNEIYAGGSLIRYGPGAIVARQVGKSPVLCNPAGGGGGNSFFAETLTRLTFIEADGTEHEFVDAKTGGSTQTNIGTAPNCPTSPDRGTIWVSRDSSFQTILLDTPMKDNLIAPATPDSLINPEGSITGYLLASDGTRMRFVDGAITWIRDRNGNLTTYTYSNGQQLKKIQDSIGREINISYSQELSGPERDEITYSGFGGAPRKVTVYYCALGGICGDYPAATLAKKRDLFQLAGDSTSTDYNPRVVSKIELPDGRNYVLRYNSYGELTRIVLPTGGKIEYTWEGGPGATTLGVIGDASSGYQIYRRVKTRSVFNSSTAVTPELTATYYGLAPTTNCHAQAPWCSSVAVEQKQGGILLSAEKHYFYGSPHHPDSFFADGSNYPRYTEGKEYRVERLTTLTVDAGSGSGPTATGTIAQTEDRTWEERPCARTTVAQNPVFPPDDYCPPNVGTTAPQRGSPADVRLQRVDRSWNETAPTLAWSESLTYDRFNNVLMQTERAFGNVDFRKTERSYVDVAALSQGNVNYVDVKFNSQQLDLANTFHIRNLAKQEKVSEWSGTAWTLLSQTDTEYDRTALTPVPGVAAGLLDAGTGVARGNATKVIQSIVIGGSGTVSREMTYDAAGNVVSFKDPRENVTTVEYGSGFFYAWPTKVTKPLSHSFQTSYDLSSGRPVMFLDPNGKQTGYSYGDSLDRLTAVDFPDGGRTSFTYCDPGATGTNGCASSNGRVTKTVRQNSCTPGNDVTAVQHYDGLGRTFRAEQVEDGTSRIYSDVEFDGLGRTKRSSLPYRNGASPAWNTLTYDALGRVVQRQGPNGAITQYQPLGPVVTETDPAGAKWKRTTDAYGRLMQVIEDPASKAYETSYRYDGLDNLLGVCQGAAFTGSTCGSGGRSRTFAYDSLKRLKSADNPETGAILYTYDANGNVLSRLESSSTKATTYGYDALNRLLSKTFSDGTTPAVSYTWDTLFKGRMSEASNSVSKTEYTSYDAMGRVTGSRQRTPPTVSVSEAKSFSYSYNAAGGLEVETYPTGRVVKTCYDMQGRVKTVSQKVNATAAEKVVARLEDVDANTKAYEANGGEKYLRLGEAGQVVEQTAYNLSLQPYRKNVGTIWSMDLHYCGGGVSSTDCGSNNGNILKQVVLVPGNSGAYTMNYAYDSLNRITSAVELKPDGLTENWHQTFVYDRYGNRAVLNDAGTFFAKLAATPTVMNLNDGLPFDGKNRWIGAAYDAAGNQSTTWGAGVEAGSAQYEYNGENLLKQALVSNGVGMVTYGYDAEGRRVTAATGAGQTTFVYDAFGMLAMETGNVNTGGTGCTSCLVTADHLGSTRVVWDAGSGDPKRVYDYAPFGEEIDAAKRGGNPLYPATVYPSGTRNAVTQMFTGKERDAETGLDYFGARYMSSSQGRFTNPDPLLSSGRPWDPQSWNRYNYALNNPMRFNDPTGLYEWDSTLGGGCNDKTLKGGSCSGFTKAQGKSIVSQRKEIRSQLKRLNKSSDDGRLVQSAAAYGKEGVANGVTIAAPDANHKMSPNAAAQAEYYGNSNGLAQVTVRVPGTRSGDDLFVDLAHEGTHTAHAQIAQVGFVTYTRYETEMDAYLTTSAASRALGNGARSATVGSTKYVFWDPSWSAVDYQTLPHQNIHNLLNDSPNYNNPTGNPPRRLTDHVYP